MLTRQLAQSSPASVGNNYNFTTDLQKPDGFYQQHIQLHIISLPLKGVRLFGCKELYEGNCHNLIQLDDDGAPCSAKFMSYREWESLSNLLSFRSQKVHLNCRRQDFVFYIQTRLVSPSYLHYLTHHLIYILMSVNEESKYDS